MAKKTIMLLRKLYTFFIILLSLSACSDDGNVLEGKEKEQNCPNILLIIADDMGLDATPGYPEGTFKPAMPNLDNLASEGITFDNAWAYPLCSPTRASILTGKYGFRTGILSVDGSNISSSETSIQSYLDKNTPSTYAHAVIGKWHLSKFNNLNAPNDLGINHFAGYLQGALNDYHNWTLVINGESKPCTEYHTTKLTDLSIDWIKQQTKPWFCWLAYSAPHTPLHYPPSIMHNQNEAEDSQLSMYLAMIESIDYEIGRLFETLDDNTIVMFVGDNGTDKNVLQLPYRGRKAKGSLFQGGINIPLIISGKGVTRKNVRDENLISTVDLFATIADIAGSGINSYHDSYSFKPLLSSETKGLRPYNYSEVDQGDGYRFAISDGTYKLISNNNMDDELYNLAIDPYESIDLYNSTNTSDINAKLLLTEEANRIKSN